MLGIFGRFGRAHELHQLDTALKAVDVHPALVPASVQLAAVRLLQGACDSNAYAAMAELIAYCLIGASNFTAANDDAMAAAVEARIEAAIQAGDSLDAKLLLLLLHAGVVQPGVVGRFGLEID